MPSMNPIAREKLKELFARDGEGLLQDPDRCEGLLKDHISSQRREISALIGALEERVPMELKSSWQTAMTPEAMRARLEQRLQDHRGLAPDVAAWAVDAWSYAMSVPLGRDSDRLDSVVLTGATADASIGRGVAGDRAPGGLGKIEAPDDVNAARARELQGSKKVTAGAAAWNSQKKAGVAIVALLVVAALGYGVFSKKPVPVDACTDPSSAATSTSCKPPVDPCAGPATAAASCNKTPVNHDPANHDKVVVVPAAPLLSAGAPIAIRINRDLNSENLAIGQEIEGTLDAPLTSSNGNVMVPKGADAKLKVTSIDTAGKVSGKSQMQLEVVQLSSGGAKYNVVGYHTFEGPAQIMKAAERTGVGAAIGAGAGAIIGKIMRHPGKGAGAGAVAGGATGAVTGKPAPVKVQAETVVQFKLAKSIQAKG
jgi:hypothetical protein